jgi:hypothetical protein
MREIVRDFMIDCTSTPCPRGDAFSHLDLFVVRIV